MTSLRLALSVDALNPNEGDLYLNDSGQLEWIGGDINNQEDYSRMVLQRIRCRLLFIKGEWYLDQRQGTPWRQKLWIKGPSVEVVRRVVRTVVEATPGVEKIDELEVEFDSVSRTATIDVVATTDLGTLISTEQLDEPIVIEVPSG